MNINDAIKIINKTAPDLSRLDIKNMSKTDRKILHSKIKESSLSDKQKENIINLANNLKDNKFSKYEERGKEYKSSTRGEKIIKGIKQLAGARIASKEVYSKIQNRYAPQGRFISEMTDTMKNEFSNINEVSSATCFVKITKDGQSDIRQYIFDNEGGSPINKTDFAERIDEIGKNLTAEAPFVHSISQQWVIISKLPNGEFYVADGDRSFASKKINGVQHAERSGGGSHGGSRNVEGLKVAAFRLKEMGIAKDVYQAKKFMRGPYFYDLTSSPPKTGASS